MEARLEDNMYGNFFVTTLKKKISFQCPSCFGGCLVGDIVIYRNSPFLRVRIVYKLGSR